MTVPLIKLDITATSTATGTAGGVSVDVNANVTRYYMVTAGSVGAGVPIAATSFVDDFGNPVTAFPVLDPQYYYNFYVNGVLQLGSFSSIAANGSTITAVATIASNKPLIVEFVSYADAEGTVDAGGITVETTIET